MIPMTTFKSFIPFLIFLPASIAQTCYFSDGSKASGYSACNNSTEYSSCCLLYQQNGTPKDLCTTNGLCVSRSSVYNGFIFQTACTDQTWQSSSCPQACPKMSVAGSLIVQPCNASSGGLWCCRQDGSPSCCGAAKSIAIGQFILPSSSPSSASNFNTALSAQETATVTTTITTSADSNSPTSSGSLSASSQTCAANTIPVSQVNSAIVGMGISLSVALLLALGMLGWRERSWRSRPVQERIVYVKADPQGLSEDMGEATREVPKEYQEMGDGPKYYEMGYGHKHHELDGRS